MPTITSAQSGLRSAPSTWVGGVVPVLGDKIILAHPGTNLLTSTPYTLNGPRSIGDTVIPVTGGVGSIVAGESVQFEHQVGVDEDGQPAYDNTYYRVTTGITGAGSLVITPGLSYGMESGVQVVNRGHTVTFDGTSSGGDDTSSQTAANNAIVVYGTLRAPRDASSQFTARGTIFYAPGGTIDFGVPVSDPIPAGVTATVVLNDSASMSSGKHGLTSHTSDGVTFRACGKTRTRNTRLSVPVEAGATSITVDASVGWEVGDSIVLASPTVNHDDVQKVTVTGGASPTWSVTAITRARPAGTRVGNLSSNVAFRSANASFPAPAVSIHNQSSVSSARTVLRLQHVRFENIGWINGWVGGGSTNPHYYGSFGVANTSGESCYSRSCAAEGTAAGTVSGGGQAQYVNNRNRTFATDWAVFASTNTQAAYFGGNSSSTHRGCVAYRAASLNSGFDAGAINTLVIDGAGWFNAAVLSAGNNLSLQFVGGEYSSKDRLIVPGHGSVIFENSILHATNRLATYSTSGTTNVELRNCQLGGAILTGNLTQGLVPSQYAVAQLTAVNGVSGDNRRMSYWYTAMTDTDARRRSSYAVKILPKVANAAIIYNFSAPAVAGVPQTIKGSLRFDAAYGTDTPPRISIDGQGVAQSFTAPAVADTWHDFTLVFTPSSTGDMTVTVTVQSAGTTGAAWLDGVWHYPMIQSVRHHGFQWLAQTALIADPRITLSEASALALPVAVDHTAQTITVTGPVTAREVFEAAMADLVQNTNQSRVVHITSATGDSFETSYTVVLSGAGVITGAYEDAVGRHVQIEAPNLVAGSYVALLDGDTLVHSETLSSPGFSTSVIWSSDHLIELRVSHPEYLPAKATTVLTSTGATFLATQDLDTIKTEKAIDGSLVSGITANLATLTLDINRPSDLLSVWELYAWLQYYLTTPEGITSDFFGVVLAQDSTTLIFDSSIADVKLNNTRTSPLRLTGGRIATTTGAGVIALASGSVQIDSLFEVVQSGENLGYALESTLLQLLALTAARKFSCVPSGAVLPTGSFLEIDGFPVLIDGYPIAFEEN